ncbi:NADP-dependent oxidoreductase [Pontibacter sp. H249]|uniref:NADP-dependent oxidoreductase n=1 Tax=Pontibacter sp. H249 TaxID=3133420 RepID=UPI0030BF4E12
MNSKKILLRSRPQGMPNESNFEFTEQEVSSPAEGEVLLKALYISVDPYMRGRMSETKSYVPPYKLHEPISGGVVAEVVESRHSKYKSGDNVLGNLPWATYTLSDGNGLHKINPNLAPLSYHLGILGMPGLTAYCGLLFIGEPKQGETVVVSGAAGAVGMVVGQIAKLKGCRVVGIAGSDEKISYLKEQLGFDEGINYKTTSNMQEALEKACPEGVDIYFDNVGGEISDAVYTLLNNFSRIIICGQIALYNVTSRPTGPRVEPLLLTKKSLMKGFIVSDYAERFEEASKELATWVKAGNLKYEESIAEGFDKLPEAFLGLFKGENIGKQLVKVAE